MTHQTEDTHLSTDLSVAYVLECEKLKIRVETDLA